MKAIYGRKLYMVIKDIEEGVELAPVEGHFGLDDVFYVGYDDPELNLDPTNDKIEDITGWNHLTHFRSKNV